MKPILFSTPMVQAILDGRKTMTRRVIKPQPNFIQPSGRWVWPIPKSKVHPMCCTEVCTASREWWEYLAKDQFPHNKGDILWVRETWMYAGTDKRNNPGFYYKADNKHLTLEKLGIRFKWRPSIHMPREAARIFLRVTNVRAERVQDILCEDMKREGCIPETITGGQWQQWQRDYFAPLWDSTIKPADMPLYGWDSNPWVWVYTFERCEKPVEAAQ